VLHTAVAAELSAYWSTARQSEWLRSRTELGTSSYPNIPSRAGQDAAARLGELPERTVSRATRLDSGSFPGKPSSDDLGVAISRHRRHHLAVLAAVTIAMSAVTACSSSGSQPSGGASPTLPAGSATPSGPLAGLASTGTLNTSDACADVGKIKSLNDQFNSAGEGLAQGRALAASLKQAADALLPDVTDDISSDAHTFDAEVGVVNTYIDKASSLPELGREARNTPALRSALSQIGTAETALVAWATANC
jgi:hypothetical protein